MPGRTSKMDEAAETHLRCHLLLAIRCQCRPRASRNRKGSARGTPCCSNIGTAWRSPSTAAACKRHNSHFRRDITGHISGRSAVPTRQCQGSHVLIVTVRGAVEAVGLQLPETLLQPDTCNLHTDGHVSLIQQQQPGAPNFACGTKVQDNRVVRTPGLEEVHELEDGPETWARASRVARNLPTWDCRCQRHSSTQIPNAFQIQKHLVICHYCRPFPEPA